MAARSVGNIFLRLSVSVYDLSVPCRMTLASKSSSLAVGLSVWHVRAGSLVVESMAPAGPGAVSPTFFACMDFSSVDRDKEAIGERATHCLRPSCSLRSLPGLSLLSSVSRKTTLFFSSPDLAWKMRRNCLLMGNFLALFNVYQDRATAK